MNNSRPDPLTCILIEKLLAEKMPRAGSYARAIAFGEAMLSGNDIRGSARNYAGQYYHTRQAVISLIVGAGLARIATGKHGRRYFEYLDQ